MVAAAAAAAKGQSRFERARLSNSHLPFFSVTPPPFPLARQTDRERVADGRKERRRLLYLYFEQKRSDSSEGRERVFKGRGLDHCKEAEREGSAAERERRILVEFRWFDRGATSADRSFSSLLLSPHARREQFPNQFPWPKCLLPFCWPLDLLFFSFFFFIFLLFFFSVLAAFSFARPLRPQFDGKDTHSMEMGVLRGRGKKVGRRREGEREVVRRDSFCVACNDTTTAASAAINNSAICRRRPPPPPADRPTQSAPPLHRPLRATTATNRARARPSIREFSSSP